MLNFLLNNVSTILVGTAVAFGIIAILAKMRSDKKQGKSSCGCSCADCPSAGLCHAKK